MYFQTVWSWLLFYGDHLDGDVRLDFFVEVDDGSVGTEFLYRSFEAYTLAIHVDAFFFKLRDDHQRSDGAEEASIRTSQCSDLELEASKFLGDLESFIFDVLQAVRSLTEVFLEDFLGGFGSQSCDALGNQVIPGISGLDRNDVVFLAKTFVVFKENDFHDYLTVSVTKGSRPR